MCLRLCLMLKKYRANLNFKHNLVKVDGPNRMAWFEKVDQDGQTRLVEKTFDMLHVCPPQSAPDFIKKSPLSDQSGWVDVDAQSLQHKRYPNIWGIGDVTNTPNAKNCRCCKSPSSCSSLQFTCEYRFGDTAVKLSGLWFHAL